MKGKKYYDYLIIGSGFGGSVCSLRLIEQGKSVALLEMGKDYSNTNDLPHSSWDLKRYLWFPFFRCFGIQKLTFLKHLFLLHGVGVGGGSLVYANTLLRPSLDIYKQGHWPDSVPWENELPKYFDRAEKMLGVVENPYMGPADNELKKLAKSFDVDDSFAAARVGVFFGEPAKEVDDPYFNGEGPVRSGCTFCGGCMVGCKENAKNTLDKNYLYLARKKGLDLFAQTKVKKIIPQKEGYLIEAYDPTKWIKRKKVFHAKNIILSAGVLGTIDLLLKNRDVYKTLPKLSQKLGETVRTNGESLVGATAVNNKGPDFSKGLAIGSSIRPFHDVKVEPCRYPPGSDVLKFLAIPLGGVKAKIKQLFLVWKKDWASRSIILLYMQAIDQKMSLGLKRGVLFGQSLNSFRPNWTQKNHNEKANQMALKLAQNIQGIPEHSLTESLLGKATTAHILGGVNMGEKSDDSVINTAHEVHHYKGLYVCDGSVIPSNLGVNPSLTITALSERFCELLEQDNFQDS